MSGFTIRHGKHRQASALPRSIFTRLMTAVGICTWICRATLRGQNRRNDEYVLRRMPIWPMAKVILSRSIRDRDRAKTWVAFTSEECRECSKTRRARRVPTYLSIYTLQGIRYGGIKIRANELRPFGLLSSFLPPPLCCHACQFRQRSDQRLSND